MLKIEPDFERDDDHHHTFCSLPYNKLILNSDGNVSMCCHQQTQLGSIKGDTTILELWRNSLANDIREETTKGNLHPVCTQSNSCPYIFRDRVFGPAPIYKKMMYPTYLEICLPDKHCNIGGEIPSASNPACIMCKRNFVTPDQEDLTDMLCEKARPLMPYLKHLCLLGVAEPFWKDAVFRMYEKVEFHRYKHNIQFTTNTNGTCLNEKLASRFFDETMYSDLSWSLDAATRDTHIKIRRLDALDLVVKNLKRWIELREDYGGKSCHKVSIYNNINIINVNEMTQMVEMAVDIGVDYMIMLPTYEQDGIVKLGEMILCDKNVGVFKEESERAMERAKELGLDLLYQNRFDKVLPNLEEELVQLI
jgi:MoaA/NifB/PqqE/SkfB family radical SAM enzyme